MPKCPNCGNTMTSGEECRLQQAVGHCFACYPGGPTALLDFIMGGSNEEEGYEEELEDWADRITHKGLPS